LPTSVFPIEPCTIELLNPTPLSGSLSCAAILRRRLLFSSLPWPFHAQPLVVLSLGGLPRQPGRFLLYGGSEGAPQNLFSSEARPLVSLLFTRSSPFSASRIFTQRFR
jgi:hypothetical protein